MSVLFYVSGHGFGHASRVVEVVNALRRNRPDLEIAVRTSARRWLFDLTLTRPVVFEDAEVDTGIVQRDSLRLDEAATVEAAERFYATFDERIAHEAIVVAAHGARLVVGDIPPLAFPAAARAGVPGIALGNFTWDWIYRGYDGWTEGATLGRIGDAYAAARAAWRLPMSGGFSSIHPVIDVPFIARRSCRGRDDTRTQLGLPALQPLVLFSFGGLGLEVEFPDLRRANFTVITTGSHAGAAVSRRDERTGAIQLDEARLYDMGLRYEDLVAAADIVLTKPGYGIIAECIANETAMLYTSRGRFVEYDVLVREMPRYLRCRYVSQEEVFDGRWVGGVEPLLASPPPPERPRVDGAEVVAGLIEKAY